MQIMFKKIQVNWGRIYIWIWVNNESANIWLVIYSCKRIYSRNNIFQQSCVIYSNTAYMYYSVIIFQLQRNSYSLGWNRWHILGLVVNIIIMTISYHLV